MKNLRFFNRRKFIWMSGIGSAAAVLASFDKSSTAQQTPRTPPKQIPGTTANLRALRLSQNTQLLLRDLRSADSKEPTFLSKSRKISPELLEESFTKLNDAFKFDQTSGRLSRNPAVQLSSDEERIVQQILMGYQRQVQAGEIKLRRGANQLFVPFANEPEIERQGSVTQLSREQIKSLEKLSKQSLLDFSVLSPGFETPSNPINADHYLLAGCGWQWWRKAYWWGIRFSLNRTAVNWLTSGAASVSAILGAMGVSGIVAAAVAALAGILKAVSNENGVRIYITWVGVPWATSKPTSSGGC